MTAVAPTLGADRFAWTADDEAVIFDVDSPDAFEVTDSLGTIAGIAFSQPNDFTIEILFPRVIVAAVSAEIMYPTAVYFEDGLPLVGPYVTFF